MIFKIDRTKIKIPLQEIHVALPEVETSLQEINAALPEVETSLQEINAALPELKTSLPAFNASLTEVDDSLREVDNSELGSITPLITLYFTIAMLLIFLVANLSSIYIARRELINQTEAALSKAAQELDEFVYYYQVPLPSLLSQQNDLVPINCSDAGKTFSREFLMSNQTSENKKIQILDFSCDGRLLGATVQSAAPLPFAVKVFGIESFQNKVTVEAVSQYE